MRGDKLQITGATKIIEKEAFNLCSQVYHGETAAPLELFEQIALRIAKSNLGGDNPAVQYAASGIRDP